MLPQLYTKSAIDNFPFHITEMYSLLSGAIRWIFAKRVQRVLLVGLDNSGKTVPFPQTFLEQLKRHFRLPALPSHKIPPTVGLNSTIHIVCNLQLNGVHVVIWDLGGRMSLRQMWSHYYSECNALIFMVDGTDRERTEESHDVLQDLMECTELSGLPLLLIINKNEKEGCMSLGFIKELLNIAEIKDRAVDIIYGSSFTQ